MRFTSKFVLSLALLLIASSALPAQGEELVTTCGQTVSGAARLVADLDCSGEPLPSLVFGSSGTLQLDGHTLTGEVAGSVLRIEIVGPGTITGPGYGVSNGGVVAFGSQIVVRDAAIERNERTGLVAFAVGANAAVQVYDSSITGNGTSGSGSGLAAGVTVTCPFTGCDPLQKAVVKNSIVADNASSGVAASDVTVLGSILTNNGGHGILLTNRDSTRKLKIRNSTVDHNGGYGIRISSWRHARVVARDTSVSYNDIGIYDPTTNFKGRVQLKRVTLEGNRVGIQVPAQNPRPHENDGRVTMVDSSIIDSIENGVLMGFPMPLAMRRSSVTGSGSGPECGVSIACADLNTGIEPRFRSDSTCGKSHVDRTGIPGETWGICAND